MESETISVFVNMMANNSLFLTFSENLSAFAIHYFCFQIYLFKNLRHVPISFNEDRFSHKFMYNQMSFASVCKDLLRHNVIEIREIR